jgi:hypothetical protein
VTGTSSLLNKRSLASVNSSMTRDDRSNQQLAPVQRRAGLDR